MDTEETTSSTSDRLLSLRKEYKRTSVSLAKATAHLDFVSSCKEREQTPKGLKVNVRCSALMADLTDVKEKFNHTTTLAEGSYVDHLKTHYEEVTTQLQEKKNLISNTMATLQGQATTHENQTHQDMLTKTDGNIRRLSLDLSNKKKRKLDTINRPNPRAKRRRTTTDRTGPPPPRTGPPRTGPPPPNTVSTNNNPPIPPAQSSNTHIRPLFPQSPMLYPPAASPSTIPSPPARTDGNDPCTAIQ
jgi:hypothetical protein